MGRKIAIVGASIEGFMQLSMLVRHRRVFQEFYDDEYTLIHDPDKVHDYTLAPAGVVFFETLEREIFITKTWMNKYVSNVELCGYKYIGWGNRTDKNFFLSGCGQTFDVEKFRQRLIEDGGQIFGPTVNIVEKRIDSFEAGIDGCIINGDEYDYVIDCTNKEPLGWEDDYMNPPISFANTVYSIEKPIAGDWNYMIDYAAKNGHIVCTPLKDKQIWSYYYNDEYNNIDEIKEELATVFPDEDITKYKSNSFDWRPRISNYIIHPENKRYFKNGGALISIDPSLLFTSEYTELVGHQITEYIFGKGGNEDIELSMLEMYSKFCIQTLCSFLGFLYQYGSRHESKFWDMAEFKAQEYIENAIFLHPNVFPGKKWRNKILTESWGDEEFRMAHHRHLLHEDDWTRREDKLPFQWMSNSNLFYELAIGLGAPYAQYLKTLGDAYPPEDFGTIGYECV